MEIRQKRLEDGQLVVNEDFIPLLERNGLLSALGLWQIEDEPVKALVSERRTGRFWLENEAGDKVEFYIKRCFPSSIGSRVKSMFSLKFHDFDAMNEWRALVLFHKNLLPTLIPVAAGKLDKGTFCVTLGLKSYKRASEMLSKDFGLSDDERKDVISKVAVYAAKMHKCGFAHQDLYLLHFFMKLPEKAPFLIDLQRVIVQKRLRRRWAIKDLAQLLFSARLVLSEDEIDFLLDAYCHEIGFDIRQDKRLFKDIEKKANWMMRRHIRKSAS